ncbi:MAG: hypothetical protein JNM51_04145, partial [Bacteroidia bacterium]|nr:hypothetical protein [Bacteroidia bacterium]
MIKKLLDKKENNHVWNFSTVGGVKRVNLESGADLMNLENLDPKLWTALSCPVNGLEIDKKTLELIDADKDGQIRVPEIIAAVNWITSILKNPDDLLNNESVFQLSSIDETTELGKTLSDSAKIILKNLGKETAIKLTVEETSDTEKIFSGTRFNGDGIITEDTTSELELITLINEIISCVGSVADRGGKQGISLDMLNAFMDNCEKYSAWYSKKEADLATIFPLAEH